MPFQKPLINKIDRMCKNNNIKVAYEAKNKLTTIIKKGKEFLDRNLQRHRNVVYNIQCKDCDAEYIGATKQNLCTRVDEHRKNINSLPKYHSVVTVHKLTNDHDYKWDKVKIMDVEQNYRKRMISEMLSIKTSKNSINKQNDTKK